MSPTPLFVIDVHYFIVLMNIVMLKWLILVSVVKSVPKDVCIRFAKLTNVHLYF